MVWFKVDDSLHSHVKAMRAGEAALGLWALAGSWCADQLTDGWIPAYAAHRLTPRASELAAELVRAGLWTPETHDGEDGWQFHEWGEYQPTRESVEARRRSDAERRARWRNGRKTQSPQPESQPASQSESRRDAERASRGASVLPDPTRPDPVSPDGDTSGAPRTRARATRLPDDFAVTDEMRSWAASKTPDVAVDYETEKFADYWRAQSGQRGTKRDWLGTWRNWIRRAQEDAGRRRPQPKAQPAMSTADQRIAALQARKRTPDAPPDQFDGQGFRALPGGRTA